MKYKFTFKKARYSDRFSMCDGTPSTTVRYHGEDIGLLHTDDSWRGAHTGRWYLRIKVNSGKNRCPWEWRRLSISFSSEEEGRQYIKEHSLPLYRLMADIYKDNGDVANG